MSPQLGAFALVSVLGLSTTDAVYSFLQRSREPYRERSLPIFEVSGFRSNDDGYFTFHWKLLINGSSAEWVEESVTATQVHLERVSDLIALQSAGDSIAVRYRLRADPKDSRVRSALAQRGVVVAVNVAPNGPLPAEPGWAIYQFALGEGRPKGIYCIAWVNSARRHERTVTSFSLGSPKAKGSRQVWLPTWDSIGPNLDLWRVYRGDGSRASSPTPTGS